MEWQINVWLRGVAEPGAGNTKIKLNPDIWRWFSDWWCWYLTVSQLCSLIVLQIFSLIIWHCCWVMVSVTVWHFCSCSLLQSFSYTMWHLRMQIFLSLNTNCLFVCLFPDLWSMTVLQSWVPSVVQTSSITLVHFCSILSEHFCSLTTSRTWAQTSSVTFLQTFSNVAVQRLSVTVWHFSSCKNSLSCCCSQMT